MQRTSLLLFAIAWCVCVNAQTEKFSASLKLFLAAGQKEARFLETRAGVQYIPSFIEFNEGVESVVALQKQGVEVRTLAGTVCTADIPLDKLRKVASMDFVKRIELPLLFRKGEDTLMKKFTTVNKVQRGSPPLAMPYTGKGVVIGIIDDGIEFGHPDFLDSTGKTTINAIWNMGYAGHPPPGFGYGTVWEKDTLNYFLAHNYNLSSPYPLQQKFGYTGHGTSVASLAAGRDGVAPDAVVVAVALTAFIDTLLRSDRIVDGIAFIYARAKALEKKCVINISLGTQWGGPHDGKTLVEKAIDNFCRDKPDLLVCTSAGNDGNNWKHWGGFPVRADSSFGFARLAYEGSLYFSIPKQYSSTLRIAITDSRSPNLNAPVISKDSIAYQTPFLRIDSIIQSPVPVVFSGYLKNGRLSSTISFAGSHYNDDYDELIVSLHEYTSSPSGLPIDWHLYRFVFKGSGTVHGWFPFLNLHPAFIFNNNPYPNDSTYVNTDNNFSTGIPTHAFTVLSSGAYNLRNCYVNPLQNKVIGAYPPCQLTYFTSRGPTLDGRIKPDVISPGENVLAARSRWDTYLGHEFIIDTNYQMFGGTSASSPITAGVAALVWQKFSAYARDSVIQRIKSTAYSDAYTSAVFGAVPNNVAGWGKVDAFKALTGEGTDLVAACNERAVCKVDAPPPVPVQPTVTDDIKIYPNPSTGTVFVRYTSLQPLTVWVYNTIGQLVYKAGLPVAPNGQTRSLPLRHLSSGIYYFTCAGTGSAFTKPVVILR